MSKSEEKLYRIDTQHHIIPDFYLKKLEDIGITNDAAVNKPFARWNESEMIDLMDQVNIKAAITSISDPGVNFLDEQFAVSLAKQCNDYSAELIQRYPGKIGAFGTLPLPYIDASLAEIERCFDTLKLDGIILLSNYSKYYLGHDLFRPIFEELNKRGAVVFIHPTIPVSYNPDNAIMMPAALDFVFDSTRSIVSLLVSGYISSYSHIKFIIAHAGGVLPYLTARLGYMEEYAKSMPVEKAPKWFDKTPGGFQNALKSLYYDTALSSKPLTMKCLLDLVPSDHVMFGSDFPKVRESVVKAQMKDFDEFFISDKKTRDQICHKTAEKLFPRFTKRE